METGSGEKIVPPFFSWIITAERRIILLTVATLELLKYCHAPFILTKKKKKNPVHKTPAKKATRSSEKVPESFLRLRSIILLRNKDTSTCLGVCKVCNLSVKSCVSPSTAALYIVPLVSRVAHFSVSVCDFLQQQWLKCRVVYLRLPAERSLFSATKRICFLIGGPCPAPSLFCKRSLLSVMSYQDQFGFVAGGGGGLWIGPRHAAASPRGVVDGVRRGLGRGGRGHRHLLLLRLTDGAQRRPGKCLYGGASLGGGAAHEGHETPVELHTNTHAGFSVWPQQDRAAGFTII